jgi:putative transposase
MCRRYGVTRGGYYAWKSRGRSARILEDERLAEEIRDTFERSRGTYGSPRVLQVLRARGFATSAKRVARIMRKNGLRSRSVRIYKRAPGSHRFFTNIPNRQRKKRITLPNQVWVGDVTYLRKGNEWRFLAAVMDKFSRKILGWAIGDKRDVNLTIKALDVAVRNRRPKPGLIFHTDRGIEYAAFAFQEHLAKLGIVQSMNRRLRMNDNAHMESFFHSLKSDEYHKKTFSSDEELEDMIKGYLPFYNQERLHSGIGYQSPVQFEDNLC